MHVRLIRIAAGIAATVTSSASPAMAETWVQLGSSDSGDIWSVDKDSIDRDNNDQLVYFTDKVSSNDGTDIVDEAVDCQKRIEYALKINSQYMTGWRDHGKPVQPDTAMDAVLSYVCANAR